jgi:hypothetical protein
MDRKPAEQTNEEQPTPVPSRPKRIKRNPAYLADYVT